MSEHDERKARLTDAKRALLARRLSGQGAAATIPRRAPVGDAPLSFAQQRLWYLTRLEPDAPVYNLTIAFQLAGALRADALDGAWAQVVSRHDALRTTIVQVNGEPVQRVHQSPVPIEHVDLEPLAEDRRDADVRRHMAELAAAVIDVEHGPIARARLLRLSATGHVLLLVVHHIAFDGWSVGVLRRELQAAYEEAVAGRASSLHALPVQYADFAVWQRAWLQGPELERQLGYWRRQLGGELPVLELPADRPRPRQQSFRGAVERFEIPGEIVEALNRIAHAEGATLFMTLLAAWNVVLARHTGLEDILVGTPVANRARPELENLIGFFANTLVLRTSLAGAPTFRELLRRVRETSLGAFEHQDMPFERLVEELRPPRDLSRTPIYQAMFSLENDAAAPGSAGGVEWRPMEFMGEVARTDTTMFLGRTSGGVAGLLEFNTDLFDHATGRRLVSHFVTLLQSLSRNTDETIWALPMLPDAERRQVVQAWNATGADIPSVSGVGALVERQVAHRAGHVAVRDRTTSVTYAQLDARAREIAGHLAARDIAPGDVVAVCLDRSVDLVAAVLGVWKAGAAYVPIDPEHPAERIAHVVNDCGARVLLTTSDLLRALPAASDRPVVCLDRPVEGGGATPAPRARRDDGIAYVIYTSGSTGRPKGVRVPHRAVVNFLQSMSHRPGLGESDVLLAVTTLSFDISVLELFLPLVQGATVVIAAADDARDGVALRELMGAVRPTVMQATPSTWQMLFDAGWQGDRSLRVLCGGEALGIELARRLCNAVPELWNMYGPTETTIWSTCGRVLPGEQRVTIGQPIANTRVYVLDRHGQVAPVGVPGEAFIAGDGVASGYHNRPDLTAERFVADPVDPASGRAYRTGDLVRWLADGRLEHLGRMDRQIKLNGFRIEPAEIEAALERLPDVRKAAVAVRGDQDNRRLVAYVVSGSKRPPTSTEVRRELSRALPPYMIPALVVALDDLPLTANAKVDYNALPDPLERRTAPRVHEAPVGATEVAIAAVWSQLLGGVKVGRHDNFFELGGHSLLSIRAATAIEAQLGRRVDPRTFFFQTLHQISAGIETPSPSPAR